MRPVIVTGCGRSGTAYVAQVIRATGIDCGHERHFNGIDPPGPVPTDLVESSWLAAPYLHNLPPDSEVVHLVRHPLPVIASWLANRSIERRFVRRYLLKHCPQALSGPGPENRVMRYWLEWNQKVERFATLTVTPLQVETLICEDLGWLLADRGDFLSIEAAAHEAIKSVSKITNRKAVVRPLRWEDLPAGPVLDSVREMAERFGYDAG